jgi:hypothetical protein
MNFGDKVDKFATDAMKKAARERTGIIIALFGDIISDTPVGNPENWRSGGSADGYVGGRLRTNWQTTMNGYAQGVIDSIDVNRPIRQVMSTVQDNSDTIYFANNMPYAGRIEFTGWSWKQAPAGMVRKNIARHKQRGILS